MSGATVRLNGWKAIVLVLALGGFGLFRLATARAKLNAENRAALETRIRLDVIRPLLADTTAPLAERGATALKASKVRILSVQARGPLNNAVVRVELDPSALPPGTETERFYHMRYTTLTGWTLFGRTSELRWYLAAF